jgi:hypothetical protein
MYLRQTCLTPKCLLLITTSYVFLSYAESQFGPYSRGKHLHSAKEQTEAQKGKMLKQG